MIEKLTLILYGDLLDIKARKRRLMKSLISLLILGTLSAGCQSPYFKFLLEDDNPIEEFVEDEIQDYTGLDIDFSPDSPEK